MNHERLTQVLRRPLVTEKSTRVRAEANQLAFEVATDASKREIKKAVEDRFGVRVEKVTTANVKGKPKRFGRIQGRRSDWKKAYVRLAEGQDIDFFGAE
ncbi:MAG TPA: 50S ribosomal protein L23 [Gammaproteobacteria bacterium]|nr:50S ribosomal protein L23 [Gammaproteobacteria bacterium]